MDFDLMEQKCQTNQVKIDLTLINLLYYVLIWKYTLIWRLFLFQYRIVEEFRADALLIVHNTVIYHGPHGNMADLARQMYRDCTYDLKEIAQCRDCYRFAVEKPTKYWFCKPCRPFHELVCSSIFQVRITNSGCFKTSNYALIYFRCMPNKKGFHIGLPKSWGSYQVPQDPIKIASMMLDFLEVITKELWLKSNAFVQSQSIFIHLRYDKKNTILLCFFKSYRPKKFMESSSRNFQKNGKYPNFMSFLDRIF